MRKYILKRLIQQVPMLLGLTFITFLLLYLAPGDAAQKKLTAQGVVVSQAVIDKEREEMGISQPFAGQYVRWLSGILKGNLGTSYKDGLPVTPKLMTALGYTLILTLSSLLLTIVISIVLGVWAAVKKGRVIDHLIRGLSFGSNCIPAFLLAVLLMYFFCIRLKWLPVISDGTAKSMILPLLSLSIPLSGRLIRQLRAEMLEELEKEYVAAARSRGLSQWRLLYQNVLHNCLISMITLAGMSVGTLMGGSVVIETIFGWPGMGRLVMEAITDRDYPIVQGFVLVSAIIYMLINLITDMSYKHLDPRVERL